MLQTSQKRVKNSCRWEADQLAACKRGRDVAVTQIGIVREGIEPENLDSMSWRPNQSATLPPQYSHIYNLFHSFFGYGIFYWRPYIIGILSN